jgi:LysM repeat protein
MRLMTKRSYNRKLVAWAAGIALLLAHSPLALAQDATVAPPTPVPAPAGMTPEPQATPAPAGSWVSPTPDAAGVITLVVQPNESLWAIAARAGLSLADLLALNGLTENDIIQPGDVLIIGYGTPNGGLLTVEEQTPTPTLPPPTLRPTQTSPRAAICISAFEDSDQDMVHDPGEPLRAGVAFTIYNATEVVANYITDGFSEPACIEDLAPGQYSVTRSISPGELLTTDGNWALTLTAGSMLQQAFGSVMRSQAGAAVQGVATQASGTPAAGNPTAAASGGPAVAAVGDQPPPVRSLAVALAVGGGLLLIAAVLIFLFRQARRAD